MPRDGLDYSKTTIAELKEFLEEEGYDPEYADGKRKAEIIAAIESEGLLAKLDNRVFGSALSSAVLLDDEPNNVTSNYREQPQVKSAYPDRGTKEWNDFVLSQFNDDERVEYTTSEGRKIDAVRADGLRRVGQKVLGNVLFSGPVDQHIDYNGLKGLPSAWVKYRIVIQSYSGQVQEYVSLGDVSYLNTEDTFLGFALTTAETRAKGRAWREALGVKTYAIEEFSGKKNTAAAVEEITSADWEDGPTTGAQMRQIKNMCNKLGINTYKFINSQGKDLSFSDSKVRFTGLDDELFMKKNASGAIAILNKMQQALIPVHPTLKVEE